jgi:hypothetical protein
LMAWTSTRSSSPKAQVTVHAAGARSRPHRIIITLRMLILLRIGGRGRVEGDRRNRLRV